MNPKKNVTNLLKAKVPKKRVRDTTKNTRRSPFHAREVALFLLFIAFLGLGAFSALGRTDDEQIARGVTVGPFHVGGMTKAEARQVIGEGIAGYTLSFFAPGLGTVDVPLDDKNDLRIDVEAAVLEAYNYGRGNGVLGSTTDIIKAATVGTHLPLPADISPAALTAELKNGFPDLVQPAQNASFHIKVNDDGTYETEILPPHDGMNFDADELLSTIADRIDILSRESIAISVHADTAELDISDVTPLLTDIAAALARLPLTMTAGEEHWALTKNVVADWVMPVPDTNGTPMLSLDKTKVSTYIEARGAAIATKPKNAVFRLVDGRVAEFAPHRNGQTLDLDASHELLVSAILLGDAKDQYLNLPVMTVEPDITLADTNDFGINELIGVGESNFRGSPSNRRKNIARGAELVRGVIVAPNEEFSLLKILEPFDSTNGYYPELVIKENRTIPEYGGGLCQIGTTTFRGVLDTGLVVTARQNHSYRVPYYERDGDGNYMGPGTDATIYDPAPDFRFINDTKGHVMIWTYINGDRLTFEYWGTSDGRTVSRSEVSVWNVIPPPPTKIVKTTDLAPGVKRCTESPHSGSTASFTYTVDYADGRKEERDFLSVYRPWQEVCLLGVTEEELAMENQESAKDGEVAGEADENDIALPSADAAGAAGE